MHEGRSWWIYWRVKWTLYQGRLFNRWDTREQVWSRYSNHHQSPKDQIRCWSRMQNTLSITLMKNMKHTLLFIPILLLSSCTIDWNDGKDTRITTPHAKTEKLNTKSEEKKETTKYPEDDFFETRLYKCEKNAAWEQNNQCHEVILMCNKKNLCTSDIINITCWDDYFKDKTSRCECKTENGITYSRRACK